MILLDAIKVILQRALKQVERKDCGHFETYNSSCKCESVSGLFVYLYSNMMIILLLIQILIIWYGRPHSSLFFLFRNVLPIFDLLFIYINSRISFSKSKNPTGFLTGIVLNEMIILSYAQICFFISKVMRII